MVYVLTTLMDLKWCSTEVYYHHHPCHLSHHLLKIVCEHEIDVSSPSRGFGKKIAS